MGTDHLEASERERPVSSDASADHAHFRQRLWASPAGRALFALLLVLRWARSSTPTAPFSSIAPIATPCAQASVFGILACGMTLVIITGGIDLAVGSVLALVAVVSR